ncbi:hypothetical protein ER308_15980 [Egibacter rhizosphaerae]|uniref:YbaK/aminoacyl-tRNA synthetase-associated domain-containing protein n=1 Tax=Egibacter rhizosphaerae TaxID=1670831 RepID=A0A411YIL6_9ACTN|nr:YbaK/EbsC family protein [Egibacter rhizosphaerae]QBI20926.1 hypothetical protein ER308_15980 [Egibacter rhizosphaerae]
MTDEETEQRVRDRLEQLGVDHELLWIDPTHAATADFCREYGEDPDAAGNCIAVIGKAAEPVYGACVVRATRRLDVNRRVKRLLGTRKASFAAADDTRARTGMAPDGVTPFGLPEGWPVYLDAGLLEHARIVVGGGSRRLKVVVGPDGLRALPGAEVIDDLVLPLAG